MIKNFTELQERVRSSESLVVSVTQAADQEVPLSIKAAVDQGFIKPVLTGNRGRIEELCGYIGLKLLGILQIGTEEGAAERAVRVVHDGSVQVLMKGLVNTSVYMRGILNKEWGSRTGRLLSTIAIYKALGYHKLLFCPDSGINTTLNPEQKKDILRNLLYAVRNMGIQSLKVVVLTVNEMVNLKMVSTMDAVGLVEAVKNEKGFLPCIIEGPTVFDVAFDPKSAARKKIDSRITGDVDLAIFPNIETDNIMGKSWVHLCRSLWGGIVLGTSNPVILGLRSGTAGTKLNSTASACLAAQSGK